MIEENYLFSQIIHFMFHIMLLLLANTCISFLGWWLSMENEDSFFQKLQPLEDFPRLFSKAERFGKWNNKTLGIILVS